MDNNWAAEHLQTIRTLMERSALYRRALAPISTFVGVVGIVAAIAGWGLKIVSDGAFAFYWMVVGIIAVAGGLLLVRKQAVQQGESFWSPPTRRIVQAMSPALFAGLIMGCLVVFHQFQDRGISLTQEGEFIVTTLVGIWTLLYGLALNAAGFFMPRGIRLFSWAFIIIGLIVIIVISVVAPASWLIHRHFLMGILFGASHLAYGIYLYFTERKNEA